MGPGLSFQAPRAPPTGASGGRHGHGPSFLSKYQAQPAGHSACRLPRAGFLLPCEHYPIQSSRHQEGTAPVPCGTGGQRGPKSQIICELKH